MLTPVEDTRLGVWLKRDDRFEVAGVRGGKARSCLAIMEATTAPGVVTAGSRHSPQVVIVARIAQHLGLACYAHVPAGPDTPETLAAKAAGAVICPERPGHNSVIKARARDHAATAGLEHIPFGMECAAAVAQTAQQTSNLPECQRLVVPVGSGMSLAGILAGLERDGRSAMPILGVVVGADPHRRLDHYAPMWQLSGQLTLVAAGVPYDQRVDAMVGGVQLDPVYEAKCARFLLPGDCLWVVGVRPMGQMELL